MKANSKKANLLAERNWKAERKCKPWQTLILPASPTDARKRMQATERDAIDFWEGKMHVSKLLLH